ncbi:nuclear transport factor 2 family protein [Rhizobium sp. TRM95111]|uniref:nuclear transport factor 2 family protein n=1 Tax=Rhizobium alarense TaxID=2846851 RepID=UPI001F3E3738|nr:nuclear transport factor 2 family protein [Rhizobium alarense]MCF3640125.1 nuclear transport factor 2 family protein [Rhizobium alarense]
MAFDPAERHRLYHDAIERRDFAEIRNLFAEDAVYASPGTGGVTEGRDAILAAFRAYFETFADQVASDSLVEALSPFSSRALWSLRATNGATGAVVERTGEEIVTFDDDGAIVRIAVEDRR